mgnify:CR=1 FL=1
MNINLENENEFLNFGKGARKRFAEKRIAKGKKPLLGIGAKQVKLANANVEKAKTTAEKVAEEMTPEIDVTGLGGEMPNVELDLPSDTGLDNGILSVADETATAEAGFLAKNKKTLMLVGGLLAVGSIVYFGFGKKLGIR